VGSKKSSSDKGKGSSKQKTIKAEVMPSPHGTRIVPRIPDELRKKVAQAVAAKDKKDGKVRRLMVQFAYGCKVLLTS